VSCVIHVLELSVSGDVACSAAHCISAPNGNQGVGRDNCPGRSASPSHQLSSSQLALTRSKRQSPIASRSVSPSPASSQSIPISRGSPHAETPSPDASGSMSPSPTPSQSIIMSITPARSET
jgi:hypothetical protein